MGVYLDLFSFRSWKSGVSPAYRMLQIYLYSIKGNFLLLLPLIRLLDSALYIRCRFDINESTMFRSTDRLTIVIPFMFWSFPVSTHRFSQLSIRRVNLFTESERLHEV